MANTTGWKCPICYDTTPLCVSLCNIPHPVCIDCVEHMTCHAVVDVHLISLTKFQRNLPGSARRHTCPLCRGGNVLYNYKTNRWTCPPRILSRYPRTGLIQFRGKSFHNARQAVNWWIRNPTCNFECAKCGEHMRSEHHLIHVFRECNRLICPFCIRLAPCTYIELRNHMNERHHGNLGFRLEEIQDQLAYIINTFIRGNDDNTPIIPTNTQEDEEDVIVQSPSLEPLTVIVQVPSHHSSPQHGD